MPKNKPTNTDVREEFNTYVDETPMTNADRRFLKREHRKALGSEREKVLEVVEKHMDSFTGMPDAVSVCVSGALNILITELKQNEK